MDARQAAEEVVDQHRLASVGYEQLGLATAVRCICGWHGSNLLYPWHVLDALLAPRRVTCETCGGDGSAGSRLVGDQGMPCSDCDGVGTVPAEPLAVLASDHAAALETRDRAIVLWQEIATTRMRERDAALAEVDEYHDSRSRHQTQLNEKPRHPRSAEAS